MKVVKSCTYSWVARGVVWCTGGGANLRPWCLPKMAVAKSNARGMLFSTAKIGQLGQLPLGNVWIRKKKNTRYLINFYGNITYASRSSSVPERHVTFYFRNGNIIHKESEE